MTAEEPLHDENVFEDVMTLASSRVARCPEHDIARLVACTAALPAAV
jgi:hypothetical protein